MKIYNATRYTNPPPELDSGLVVLYENDFFSTADHTEVDYDRVRDVALANQNAELVCIDIECWQTHDNHSTQLRDSLSKYREVLRWFKKYAPNPVLGIYGMPPRNDIYFSVAATSTPEYRRWRSMCAEMEMLADYIDAVFPSCYPRYAAYETQKRMVEEFMCAAHRYGVKRVIPFFMPYYLVVDSPEIKDQMMDGPYAQNTMDAIAAYTEEMILWDYSANTNFIPGGWWPVLQSYTS